MQTPKIILTAISSLEKLQEHRRDKIDGLWAKFGLTVRAMRRSKRLSLAPFADEMGISKSLLSYLETNRRAWSMELAEKAVHCLKRRPCPRKTRSS